MMDKFTKFFSNASRKANLENWFSQLRERVPVPLLWMIGRTQSGKTSIIKYLTSATQAEIGQGFKPCTRFSRQYLFPNPDAPLLSFLDTRGLDEPGYDPAEDLERFNQEAHVVIITVKLLDHAQESLLKVLPRIRQAKPGRPIILVLTCLHEAYPQQQHSLPYALEALQDTTSGLGLCLEEQTRRFSGLVDYVVPVDLTPPEEGFNDPDYGGDRLKSVLLEALPAAYRQTLANLNEANRDLKDVFVRQAMPHILGYSSLAATAGAIPIPWVDLLILPALQTQMIFHLAQYYGQPLTGARFAELAGTLGLGVVLRQATREALKLIPFVGSVAGGVLAGASTFALGKAFCYYYQAVHEGHVPQPEELRQYYRKELALAEEFWKRGAPGRGEKEKQ